MLGRKLVAAASFVLLISGAASAQTPSSDAARTEDSGQAGGRAVCRRPRSVAACRTPQDATSAARRVPMTLEDAVRRAIDNNLEMAVERLNPQTFDFTLASLRANYNPNATSTIGRRDNVRPPTNLLNPGQPERVDDDLQRGRHAEHAVGRRQLRADVQQQQGRVADRPAGAIRSAVQQLVPLQLHAAAAARVPHRSDAAADADGGHQPRQRRAESEGAHHQHPRGGARGVLGLRVFDSGRRRGAASRSRSRRSCSRTTRFASKSARWRRWTSCRPKRKKPRGSRR